MSEELKPCPSCGSADFLKFTTSGNNYAITNLKEEDQQKVICSAQLGGCGLSAGIGFNRDLAISNWNTRAESPELSRLRAEVEQYKRARTQDISEIKEATALMERANNALDTERAARETAERDSAFVRDKVREFGSTLGKWFPELHMPEQFALERGTHIAREFIKSRDELTALREQNASQAQRIAELVALVGEMKPFVKELIEDVRHQAEILKQIPRAQFEMLEPVAKSLIARADALLSGQPAPGPTDTQRLDWQPISTAPKDGTEILVETDRSKRRIAAYGKYCDLWMDCTNGSSIKPVRWMPLPPVVKEPSE